MIVYAIKLACIDLLLSQLNPLNKITLSQCNLLGVEEMKFKEQMCELEEQVIAVDGFFMECNAIVLKSDTGGKI